MEKGFAIEALIDWLGLLIYMIMQAEHQTVDELSKILGEHGLITDGVMEVVAGSGKNVEIVKARGKTAKGQIDESFCL